MNPSRDIDAWVTTLPIPLVSLAVDRSDQIMQLVATAGSPGGWRCEETNWRQAFRRAHRPSTIRVMTAPIPEWALDALSDVYDPVGR
jgi:hypothetical protein